jgi:restriction system protein
VVGSVFADLGFESIVTGYQNDGGIDVILKDRMGSTIGVQVKRYRNRIDVRSIRELAGALLAGGMTRGIFVTTSDYTAGSSLDRA